MIAQAMRKALTHNLGLKVVALGTAVALFALVRGDEEAQMTVDVPIILTPPAS